MAYPEQQKAVYSRLPSVKMLCYRATLYGVQAPHPKFRTVAVSGLLPFCKTWFMTGFQVKFAVCAEPKGKTAILLWSQVGKRCDKSQIFFW